MSEFKSKTTFYKPDGREDSILFTRCCAYLEAIGWEDYFRAEGYEGARFVKWGRDYIILSITGTKLAKVEEL